MLNDLIDAGFIEGLNRWTGQSAQRISPGYDTNNSTVDFEILQHPTPGEQGTTSVPGSDIAVIPSSIRLYSNYPNPFNGETVIPFSVSNRSGEVRITIMDILGRTVQEYRFESLEAGSHQVRWDSNNQNGFPVSSGTYFVRLQAGKTSMMRTLALIR